MPNLEAHRSARRRCLQGAGGWLLLAGLTACRMREDTAALNTPLPPPADATAVDWDHFGEPMVSLARTEGLQIERRLRDGQPAEVRAQWGLFRWPAAGLPEDLQRHYEAQRGWRVGSWTSLQGGGRWALLRREADAAPVGVLWLPAQGGSRDGLLLQVSLTGAR